MHFGNQSPAMLQRAMAGGRHGEQAFAAVCLVVVIEGFGDAVGVGQQAIAGCQPAVPQSALLGYLESERRAVVEHQQLRMPRSEEHTSELQSLMRISHAVFCLKKKKTTKQTIQTPT